MRHFCRTLTIAIFFTLLTAGTLTFADAQARSISYDLDIPSEELTAALQSFAVASHHKLLYRAELTSGKTSRALKGHFTAQEAMEVLLSGTGLTYEITGASVVLIKHLNDGKTSDLREQGSPSSFPKDSDGKPILLAQRSSTGISTGSTPAAEDQGVPAKEPASAAEGKDTLSEIVVTGTNIRGVENKTVPLMTFDRDAIDRSGYATTEDFILSLPQNVKSGGNSADGVLSGQGLQNIENSTAANLRGLGASSTLTLLNGHRVAPSSYGTGVDLSMIPLSAVERIEVLTDGSSAVYGADAVGGVINIILRTDFDGQESSARFDSLSQGGGEQKQVGQSIGRNWNTGGALAVLQFQDTNAIHASQRSFTANLPEPTDIYPSSKRYSGVFSAHQTLPGSLELYSDVLIEHNDSFRAYNTGGDFAEAQLSSSKTDSQSANVGLRWHTFGDWHLEGNTLFSQVNTNTFEQFSPPSFGYTNGSPYLRNLDTIEEGDLKLDGTLWSSGGSSIKAAVGGSYRAEDFSSLVEFLPLDRAVDRHVHAAYAEIYAPLISSANALFLVRKLEFSAAIRNDHYSDFGSKTNPRFGVFWAPIDQVGLRAAYSTSFRAPNPSELIADLTSTNLFVQNGYPLPNDPNGNGNVLFFGNQVLGPESSRNLSAGLDYAPVEATRLSVNYYRIVYTNRIINAPQALDVFVNPQVYGPLIRQFGSDAAVDAFVAGLEPPQSLIDLTPGGTGLAGVRYGFPYGYINAAKQTTEGFDIGSHSILSMGGNNKLVLDLNATYIRDLETTFCNGCTTTDLANTTGNPLRFRIRGSGGWSSGIWSANAAVNFSNAYSDTNVVPTGAIASFTTVDMNASWHIPSSATTVGINVTNLFNIDPPRTAPALNGVVYDPSNADPRGRVLSLQVRQRW